MVVFFFLLVISDGTVKQFRYFAMNLFVQNGASLILRLWKDWAEQIIRQLKVRKSI